MAFHANSTSGTQIENDATLSTSQATGPTVFWGLLAIAMNAMGQESPTVDLFLGSRSMKGWLLVPYLSSPIICLCDIAADCYGLATKPWRTQNSHLPDESRRSVPRSLHLHNLIAVRTILVVFAVIPQALKLYGITNIPGTQILATIYLAVALIRLVKSITLLPAEEEESESVTASSQGPGFAVWVIRWAIFLAHVVGWLWLWTTILSSLDSNLQSRRLGATFEDAVNLSDWLLIVIIGAQSVWLLLWTANLLLDFTMRIQNLRPIYMFVVCFIISSISTFLGILDRQSRFAPNASRGSVMLVVTGGVCSWLLAVLLSLIPKVGVEAGHPERRSSAASVDDSNAATASGLLVEDLENIKEYTKTEAARRLSASNTDEKRYLLENLSELDECVWRSMSFLWGADIWNPPLRPSPERTWPTDGMTKCRIVIFYWRRYMSMLPKALLEVFRHRAAHPDRLRGIRGVVVRLSYVIFLSILQNSALGFAMLPTYLKPDPLSFESRNFFFRISNKGLTFVIFNLITAGMWYGQVWDGTGTALPNWVSWLG